MAKYLISFPSGEMDLGPGGLEAAVDAAHAVVREAQRGPRPSGDVTG